MDRLDQFKVPQLIPLTDTAKRKAEQAVLRKAVSESWDRNTIREVLQCLDLYSVPVMFAL